MKLKFTQLLITLPLLTIGLSQPARATGNNGPIEEKPAKKSKSFYSRNNSAVKLYPGLVTRTWHVFAKGTKDKKIEFFVFDLEGTLIQHYRMVGGQQEKLKLERGKYVFHAFEGDEETASGKLEVR